MANDIERVRGEDLRLLEEVAAGSQRLLDQIGRTVIGQRATVEALLAAVLAEGHCLLVGVPGLAKTLLVRTLAQSLGWKFHRIQFTPDMMPADITGMELLQDDEQGRRQMVFTPGPIFANIVLADEINRTPPKTQAALLEAMQERTVHSMGRCHDLDRPFVVVATQNPIEQEGTYPLPEAQLDRFMFSLWMEYPPVEEEERIVLETTSERCESVEAIFDKEQLLRFQGLVRRIPVGRHVVSYAVALARATRPGSEAASELAQQYVEWGAGTRAAQYMVLGGKALAALRGEPAVTAEHVRQVAPHVLRHRVLLNYQAAGEGLDSGSLVKRLIQEIREPHHAAS